MKPLVAFLERLGWIAVGSTIAFGIFRALHLLIIGEIK